MLVKQKSDRDANLYYHEYKNLTYNTDFSFAVRGVNYENLTESREVWFSFKTPHCMDQLNDSSKCGPEAIEDFQAAFIFIEGHKFNFNVSWNETIYKPDFYELEIRDINSGRSEDDSLNIYRYIIDKVSKKNEIYFNLLKFNEIIG